MRRMFLAPRAKLLDLQALLYGLLVALREIVDMAALSALQLYKIVL